MNGIILVSASACMGRELMDKLVVKIDAGSLEGLPNGGSLVVNGWMVRSDNTIYFKHPSKVSHAVKRLVIPADTLFVFEGRPMSYPSTNQVRVVLGTWSVQYGLENAKKTRRLKVVEGLESLEAVREWLRKYYPPRGYTIWFARAVPPIAEGKPPITL